MNEQERKEFEELKARVLQLEALFLRFATEEDDAPADPLAAGFAAHKAAVKRG